MEICPRCRQENLIENQPYCAYCGLYQLGTYLSGSVVLNSCPDCNISLPIGDDTVILCPNCGKYLGFNADRVHPNLIEIAKNWEGKTVTFCMEVLELPIRPANALSRSRLSPIEVLALDDRGSYIVRNFATGSYGLLENARNNWRPSLV